MAAAAAASIESGIPAELVEASARALAAAREATGRLYPSSFELVSALSDFVDDCLHMGFKLAQVHKALVSQLHGVCRAFSLRTFENYRWKLNRIMQAGPRERLAERGKTSASMRGRFWPQPKPSVSGETEGEGASAPAPAPIKHEPSAAARLAVRDIRARWTRLVPVDAVQGIFSRMLDRLLAETPAQRVPASAVRDSYEPASVVSSVTPQGVVPADVSAEPSRPKISKLQMPKIKIPPPPPPRPDWRAQEEELDRELAQIRAETRASLRDYFKL